MAKMKFDFKQFVMQKGERVGLGVALGLMALLFIWGILGALGARSPAKEISLAADDLTRKVNSGDSGRGDDVKLPEIKEWIPGVDPNWLKMVQLFDPNAAGNPKRTSPLVLPVDYRVVENKYPVLVGQMYVVFLGAKSFDVANENVTYLKAKGGVAAAGKGGGGILSGGSGGKLSGQGGTSPGPGGFRPGGGPGGMKGGGAAGDKKYKDILVPVHAVVVSGTFPVKEQLELIRKALRYNSVEEMFNSGGSDATPEFAGLVVLRRELTPDGKLGEWADLKLDDPAGPIRKQYAVFRGFEPEDEDQLKHILPGLVMPRPYSLTTHYPPVDLKDIPKGEAKKDEVANAGQPGILGPGGVGPGGIGGAAGPGGMGGRGGPGGLGGGLVKQVVHYEQLGQNIDSLPKEYEGPEEATQPKFKGDFDIFEVGGYKREEGDKGAAVNPKQPGGMLGKPGGNRPPGLGDTMGPGGMAGRMQQGGQTGRVAGVGPDKQPDKALVRFVDVTVKPGHTYQYMVKVRLHNPNFKKKTHEVATSDLARKLYLESSWVLTEPVHVGPEIHFYNVDQKLMETWQNFNKKGLVGTDTNEAGKERVAVQIHRFLGIVKGTGKDKFGTKQVGEWSIAERLLVPRGEYIGKPVHVEVPAWDFEQDDFELINGRVINRLGHKAGSVEIDFSTRLVPAAKALVVDFRGGKHAYYVEPVGKVDQSVDEAATELLVLGADGKLAVRNSRSDTDPQNPGAVERADRLEHLRDRLHKIKQPPPPNAPGGGSGRGGGGS